MKQPLLLLLTLVTTLTALPNTAAPADSEARFLTNTRQLTYEGRRSGEGYFSPDGKALVFQSEREADNPFYQIYVLDLESGDINRVSPGSGKTTCSFFRPNSDDVLFASTHLDPNTRKLQKDEFDFRAAGKQRRYSWDYDEHMDIFVARRDGSNLRRLTSARGYDAEGAFSPDGSKIVFSSIRDAYPPEKLSAEDQKKLEVDPAYFAEIYIMNADGSDQRRLTFSPGYDGGPFFSPDGQRIIWRRFDKEGTTADVHTMKLDGSDVRRVTTFAAMSWAPYYHPTGKYVIFTSNKLGFSNFELYLVDAEGTREPVRITYTDGFDGLPVFSPDGKKLCWTANRTTDGKSQLFLADWNHDAALAALASASARTDGKPALTDPHAHVHAPADSTKPAAPALDVTQFSPEIRAADLRQQVTYLASDSLEGRLTGSVGAKRAADFIAETLQTAGLRPLGDNGTFFQNFEFSAGVRILTNDNHLTLTRATLQSPPTSYTIEKDFRPLSFSASGEIEADVVFAGYGLLVPGKLGEGYDSYAGLNVSNKIVLVLRYVPEEADAKRRQELNRYAGLRYKALLARNRGARGILVVSGPNSPNPGSLAALTFDSSLSGSGILAASVSTNVAHALFAAAGKDLKAIQSALDKEDPHAQGSFEIPGYRIKLKTALQNLKQTDRNVIALLPPANTNGPQEYVLVGAHYDHLGRGQMGSMSGKEDEGKIHHGADDNASGTATVLELAAALAAERQQRPDLFRRGLIFALWSGEEIGLVGSHHFAEKPVTALTNIVANVNFDMVGRLRENKLTLQGIGSSSAWRRLLEKRNVAAGFSLVLQDDPYLPTDVTSFYPKKLPVLNFFTGSHPEYHRPADTADTLDYPGMERIAQFARALLSDLVKATDRPDYLTVAQSDKGGSRDNLRAYLGTIPDYATEVVGLKLSGVRGASPADKAGIKAGDIIVEFNKQKVANIYDYTYALDAVKIGQPVEVTVLRDGKRVTLTVTPEARK
ncbi:TolB protein [Verrucomicrobiota bacterium]|nr:TolB protein [Verrucomicrobiota bacterium]